ncbi:MAG: hydrogenase maturation nickel metallochaperone HypA [Dehalococcoidia bacterium]|jgi:hydrogenase nickel incorporation protein HypA/HybF
MHEMAITQGLIDLVLEHAQKSGAKKVLRVNVVAGELSGYVDECMQFYYEQLSKGTIAEDAKLFFKRVPTQGRCRDCGHEFTIKKLDWICPECHKKNVQLVKGMELFVESIEVD